jgi:hypothetical protein
MRQDVNRVCHRIGSNGSVNAVASFAKKETLAEECKFCIAKETEPLLWIRSRAALVEDFSRVGLPAFPAGVGAVSVALPVFALSHLIETKLAPAVGSGFCGDAGGDNRKVRDIIDFAALFWLRSEISIVWA